MSNTGPGFTTAIDLLRQLSADELRQRLAVINAERSALMLLLRAAARAERVAFAPTVRKGVSDAK